MLWAKNGIVNVPENSNKRVLEPNKINELFSGEFMSKEEKKKEMCQWNEFGVVEELELSKAIDKMFSFIARDRWCYVTVYSTPQGFLFAAGNHKRKFE